MPQKMLWKKLMINKFNTIVFKNRLLYLFIIAFFFVLIVFVFLQVKKTNHKDLVYFFDVFGDSSIIKTSEGHIVIIDGGNDNSTSYKVAKYLPFWQREIDVIILSHSDKDHISGLIEILNRYQVNNVIISGVFHDSIIFDNFLNIVRRKNINLIFSKSDFDLKSKNFYIDFIYPEESLISKVVNVNNNSLVFKFSNNKKSVLFTGDIEQSTENKILQIGSSLKSDFLKIPHHGSKTSSTENFLKAVSPELSIIIANKNNKFGHPHTKIIERLQKLNMNYKITGEYGDIVLFL